MPPWFVMPRAERNLAGVIADSSGYWLLEIDEDNTGATGD